MNGLHGLNVLILESRRAGEMIALTRAYGGTPLHAPSMREQKPDYAAVLSTLERSLRRADVAALVCMTAVGTRQILKELLFQQPDLLDLLKGVPILARDTAVQNVLQAAGLKGLALPGPHGWAEVDQFLTEHFSSGQVMVLEYGDAMPRLMRRSLELGGLRMTPLSTCRTTFPFNTGPLAQAVRECALGGPDVLLLTNGVQLLHFLKYAESLNLLGETRDGLNRLVTVSIGPHCTEIARELGVRIDLQPPTHRFDHLVEYAATHIPAALQERYPLRRTS